ncbi:glycerophosphoryl diester phosphodiesterase membrane domain-containing protein [Streptomyces beijiangensis]|uniref:Glycerophosphoryl diester phosphodiesterase membrane domain-containing protein n=3 Tax=Streptomyces beijiangensis TaxID=163361 RepID=A0A939JMQ2_9ACTN|nr:glycerophosphoryl diester phosphodiesterase membrane domain-containing protein [Streptomyces beijiangensis]
MRAHWRTVLGLTLTVAVVTQLCDILVQRFLLPDPVTLDPDATGTEALNQAFDSMQSSLLALAPTLVITLVGTLFTTAMLTMVISRSVLGRPVTLKEAWGEARPRLAGLLGLTLLLALMSGAILAVGILPGALIGSAGGAVLAAFGGLAALVVVVWLMIRFTLASPALMLERRGIVQSLRRSAKLVRGTWWRIFGITLLTIVLTLVVSMIIGIPFSAIAIAVDGNSFSDLFSGTTPDFGWPYLIVSGIGAVIASTITYPISAGVTVLLYVDQRIRREALDLELARAAGLPGYETTGS